jgi:hypothetical protein
MRRRGFCSDGRVWEKYVQMRRREDDVENRERLKEEEKEKESG